MCIRQSDMADKAITKEVFATLEQQGYVVIDGAITNQQAEAALKGCDMMHRYFS